MSDAEKLVDEGLKYPAEPLILRPPVGSEVISGMRVSRGGFMRRYKPSKKVITLICLLAILMSFILYFFIWRFSVLQHERFESTCNVFFHEPNVEMEEKFSYEPNAITLSHEKIQDFPPVRIFHLLADAMSILRSPNQCYIYPLRPDVQAAIPTDESVVERIKERTNPQIKLKMVISPQVWMLSHENDAEERIKIHHPAAAANCSGRPIFRLRQILMSRIGEPPMSPPEFSPNQMIEPPVMMLPQGVDDTFGCPISCPLGESRDTLGGIPRRVCRCPSEESPEDFLNSNGVSQVEDDEEESDNQFEAGFSPPIEDLSVSLPWFSTIDGGLKRNRRSAPPAALGSSVVRLPRGCRLVDKLLEGGLPNQLSHVLPEMMIVKC